MVVLNLFAGAIDLTTAEGKKIYKQATAGSSRKYDLNNDPENAENLKLEIELAFKEYCWGVALNSIPVEWDNAGNPTRLIDVLQDFREVTETEMMVASGNRFDCQF